MKRKSLEVSSIEVQEEEIKHAFRNFNFPENGTNPVVIINSVTKELGLNTSYIPLPLMHPLLKMAFDKHGTCSHEIVNGRTPSGTFLRDVIANLTVEEMRAGGIDLCKIDNDGNGFDPYSYAQDVQNQILTWVSIIPGFATNVPTMAVTIKGTLLITEL